MILAHAQSRSKAIYPINSQLYSQSPQLLEQSVHAVRTVVLF